MKKTIALIAGFAPALAFAQAPAKTLPGTGLVKATEGYAALFLNFVNSVIMPVGFAMIFLWFAYGIYTTFITGASDAGSAAKGKTVILNSVIGAVVILSFWGLVNFVAGGFGLTDTGVQNVPKVPTIQVK